MTVRPWSENIWFSPCYVIRELEQEVRKGIQISDRKLKKNREAWICAVSVICYAKDRPAEWWIQIPKVDPPDVLAMNLIPREDGKGQSLSLTQFEVFEVNEHGEDPIEKQIETKLAGKDYSGMVVVAYVMKQGFYDFRKISKYVKLLNPKVVAVCLVVFENGLPDCSFIQLFPELGLIKENYRKVCGTTAQRDFLELVRSTRIEKADNATTDYLTLIP